VIPPQLTLPLEQLVPLPGLFRTRSNLHGQDHVARVMVHAFRLVVATGLADHAARLWGAVYLHDLERRHDGRCHEHGRWAWARFARDPDLQAHLAAGGVTRADWPAIRTAVTAHSRPQEIPGDDPHRVLTALLKDADALDRVRIDDLDPGYLRFPAARKMERFAWALLDRTRDLEHGPGLFARVLEQAAVLT
jgi:uncharacterized protein